MKNKYPQNIHTYFEITASQTLFIIWSVFNFVYIGRTNTELLKFEARYWEFRVANFSDFPIKFHVTSPIDLEFVGYSILLKIRKHVQCQ